LAGLFCWFRQFPDRLKTRTSCADLVLEVDFLAVGDFALVDPEREPAIGVRTHPRLEEYRSAFLTVVRQRNERSAVALQALREIHLRLLHTPQTQVSSFHPTAREPIGSIGEKQGGI